MKFRKILSATVLFFPLAAFAAETYTWTVSGATASNRRDIERSIERLRGVSKAQVDPTTGNVTVTARSGQSIDREEIRRVLSSRPGVTVSSTDTNMGTDTGLGTGAGTNTPNTNNNNNSNTYPNQE
jgi:hypothetical protein